ncbi:MAG: lamin tail domain-containing protein, partial [Salibacteraceae bacterium]
MKKLLTIFLCVPMFLFSQFSDDFSDGDFTLNPTWQGDTANFTVDNGMLRLDAPSVTDESYLSTPSQAVDTAQWDFFVRLTFNPSSSNRTKVYLMSDQADLKGSLNGYFVQIGNTEDEVSLYRQTGTSVLKIIDGSDDLVNEDPVEVHVRATRDTDGNWELLADTSLSSNYQSMGNALDTTHIASNYFGVYCDYTSTRSDRFYFDDFEVSGSAYPDTIPPELSAINVLSNDSLQLIFSEELEQASSETTSNYVVDNGIGSPVFAEQNAQNPAEVVLAFSTSFPVNQTLEISISQLEDLSGNIIQPVEESFAFYSLSTPSFRDIVINEFMADPAPVVGLPELEFVEIYNASSSFFDLNGLAFEDPSSSGVVQSFQVIAPGEHIILCHQNDVGEFEPYGRTIGLSAFPALNNGGDELTLRLDSIVLDKLTYNTSWYDDPEKSSGGFTLEQINPLSPCTGRQNWRASLNINGGTPGIQNSVFDTSPDETVPKITGYELPTNGEITLHFSERMDSLSLINGTYELDNGVTITHVLVAENKSSINLELDVQLDPAVLYTLVVSGVSDCIGNVLQSDSIKIGIGVSPNPFDLIINEIYPVPNEESILPNAEFIELYNRSGKLISTDNIRIHDRTSSSMLDKTFILPGEHVIVCDDSFESAFSTFGKVITVSSLPALNNRDDDISVQLNETIIDAISYESDWFGNDEKASGGWTLERVNPENLCGTTGNWSASSDDGQGTPGAANSIMDLTTTVLPELLGAGFTAPDQIELELSSVIDTTSEYLAAVNGVSIALKFESESDLAILNNPTDFERGDLYRITIDSLLNCAQQKVFNLSGEAYLHKEDDLVINEVLFNPIGSGTDFVEIYNTTDFDINLKHWSLGYYDSNDSLRLNSISNTAMLLPAKGYVALNEDFDN